ncbi:MAG: alpha-ribazole phosphatase family protein [Ignavibacteriaceae bacterium]
MEVFLIRHPEVDIGRGYCYGYSDVEVSAASFKSAVEKIKKHIPAYADLTYYSSDLKRCRVLAELLCSSEIFCSSEIRELNFGRWEMIRWDDLPQDELKIWMEDFVNQSGHGGESYKELYSRSVNFWKELIKKNHSKVAVITHSGVIRSILCYILNISLENSFKFNIDYSGISKININKEIEIIEFINK